MNIRSLYSHRTLVAMLVAAALAVGFLTVLVIRQQQNQANGQVYLEAGGSVGSNPFVPFIAPPATVGENPENSGSAENPEAAGAPFQTTASTAGRPACDVDKIISHLTSDSRAGEAWVRALNSDRTLNWSGGNQIEARQIPVYIRELRPRVLTEDLRVTNYQFTNGDALAVQAVLQKGTAILVDVKGIGRVRCASGNPLTPMIQSKEPPIYRGTPWPSFHPQRVVVAQHAPQCGHDESYDGQRCRRILACPHSEYRGDDGRCDGPGWPGSSENGSSENGRRPDGQWRLDRPERSDDPPHPGKPRQPDELPHPDEPTRPGESPHSDKPRLPDEPSYQDEPKHPDKSKYPGKADRPGEPPHSDKPRLPDEPSYQDEPTHPDRPRYPGKADRPGESAHADKPTRPEKPRYPGKADRPGESAHADKPTRPERDEHPDKPNRAHRPAQPDDGERTDRPKRADKPEKPGQREKTARPEKSEKPRKSDKAEKSGGEASQK